MPLLPPLFIELKATIDDFQSKFGVAEKQIQRISKNGGSDLAKLQAVGKAAFLGLGGAAVLFGGISVTEAAQQEAANARLTQALQDTGSSLTALSGPFQKAQAEARKLGFSDDAATESLAKLVVATKNPTKAIQDLALAQNVARGRGIDLAAATDILTKVETGHVALLGRIGINVKDVTGATISQQEAIRRLSDLYGGQASAYADTFAGRLAVLKAETSDLAERVGFVLIPKIEGLAKAGAGAIEWAQKHQTESKVLAAIVGGPLVLAMGAYAVAQLRSIYLTGIQVAANLPAFFLAVGAAIRGTTAAEVVLNSSTAATNATMLLGVGAVGALAGGMLLMAASQRQAAAAARSWAAEQTAGIPSVQAQLDQTNVLLAKQKDHLHDLVFSWRAPFGPSLTSIGDARDKVKALEAQAKQLGLTLKNETAGGAKAAGDALDPGLTDPVAQAAEEAKKFAQTVNAMRSDLFGVVSATRSYADAQTGVRDATADVNKASKTLSDLLKKSPVDLAAVASAQKDVTQTSKDLATALADQTSAQANLDKVRQGTAPEDIRKAQLDLADAQRSQQRATIGVDKAQDNYSKTLHDSSASADDLWSASLDLTDATTQQERAALAVTDAQDQLNRLQQAGKDGSQDLKDALQLLADKNDAVAVAQDRARDANDKLNTAQQPDAQLSADIAAARDGLAKAEGNLAKQKDGLRDSELQLWEATQKSNAAIGETPGAIDAVRASIEAFKKQFPDAATLGTAALALLPPIPPAPAPSAAPGTDFGAARGGLAGPGNGPGVLVTGDINLQVDGRTFGTITQSELAQIARRNGLT